MKIRLLISIFSVLFFNQLCAGNYSGMDISYRHIDSMRYELNIIRYRDCASIPVNSFQVNVYNDSFSVTISPVRYRISEIKSPLCSPGCNPQNTAGGTGIEAHYYRDTIDFASGVFALFGTSNYPQVFFAHYSCCRTTNLFGSEAFYVEAMLNLRYVRLSGLHVSFSEFALPPENFSNAMQTFSTSFRLKNEMKGDSMYYRPVLPRNSKTSTISGFSNPQKPVSIYCPPGGSQNCPANLSVNPVRGNNFNTGNGNVLLTPSIALGYGIWVCQPEIYRDLNNSPVLAGYCKRDFEFFVYPTPNNNLLPHIEKYGDFKIKAREKFCSDIVIRDDTGVQQLTPDTVKLEVLKQPEFGSLVLTDSFARNKTLRFCWTPNDSDYLKNHKSDFLICVRENTCNLIKRFPIAHTFTATVAAPDSLSNLLVKTYVDKNGNGKRDAGEYFAPARFFADRSGAYQLYNTGQNGQILLTLFKGEFRFGLPESASIFSRGTDTTVNAIFDSLHTIEIGFIPRTGVSGRIYEDLNNNCVFDAGDKGVQGQRIIAPGKNQSALSDENGFYYLHSKPGSLALQFSDDNLFRYTCNSTLTPVLIADSIQSGYDFAVKKRQTVSDLSVVLEPVRHIANNSRVIQRIIVKNNGFSFKSSVQLKLISSVKLNLPQSNKTIYKLSDTLVWIIDSLFPSAIRNIELSHLLSADSFKAGDKICYRFILPDDSVNFNNVAGLCETVYTDASVFRFKESHNTDKITEVNQVMVYTVGYRDSKDFNHLIIKDTLDQNIFDLESFLVLKNTGNFKVNLVGNVIFAELISNIISGNYPRITYSVRVKDRIDKIMTIRNCAEFLTEINPQSSRACVEDLSESAIQMLSISDSGWCTGQNLEIKIKTLHKPGSGNRFKIYLSDSTGNFNNAITVHDTLSNNQNAVLLFRLPLSLKPGSGYQLNIEGSNPPCRGFDENFAQNYQAHALPVPVIMMEPSDGGICRGDTLKFKVSGGEQYRFYLNQNMAGNFAFKDSLWFVPQASAYVFAEVKDIKQCIASSEKKYFEIFDLPVVKASATPSEICAGNSSVLSFEGGVSYRISQNGILWKDNVSANSLLTDTLYSNTDYRILGTDSNGCKNEVTRSVKVNPLPLKPLIYQTGKAIYSAYSVGNQWYNSSGRIDTAVNQYFYPPVNGTYRLQYTDGKGCSNMSDAYQYNYYALNGLLNEALISVYPNPVTDFLFIEYHGKGTGIIRISGNDGRVVFEMQMYPGISMADLSEIASGVYTVELSSPEGVSEQKLILIR